MKIVSPSKKCIDFIKSHEGFRVDAYLCPAGVWTIGYGTTFYPSGVKVKKGDTCDIDTALMYLKYDIKIFSQKVDSFTTDQVNQNQFDALVSFAYNVGTEALRKSTLLKLVNANPNDQRIRKEFQKWIYADGKKSGGLIKRRQDEANIYFTPL